MFFAKCTPCTSEGRGCVHVHLKLHVHVFVLFISSKYCCQLIHMQLNIIPTFLHVYVYMHVVLSKMYINTFSVHMYMYVPYMCRNVHVQRAIQCRNHRKLHGDKAGMRKHVSFAHICILQDIHERDFVFSQQHLTCMCHFHPFPSPCP